MNEGPPLVQVVVVATVDGVTRAIRSSVPCVLCERIPDDDELILRIRDFAAAGPGVHETVMHKTCVLALLAATDDDAEAFHSVLYAHHHN